MDRPRLFLGREPPDPRPGLSAPRPILRKERGFVKKFIARTFRLTVGTDQVFDAARLFYKAEGILPAPESAHAVAAVVAEALEAKRLGQEKVILFNLSGHGFLDLNAYADDGNGGRGH